MNNTITITKLPNGNYLISGPDDPWLDVQYEQAAYAISEVRVRLNYLKLPAVENWGKELANRRQETLRALDEQGMGLTFQAVVDKHTRDQVQE